MSKGVTIDLIVDPKGAIDGIDKVEGKAHNMSGVLAGLGGAAAAGIIALGAAAVSAVAGLTAATKSAGEYAENVELAASKTHLSTEAVQELQYASKVTGVEFDTITASMVKLVKAQGAAQNGNAAMADAFAELGVATTDSNGNLLDSTVVYQNVIDALGEVSNPAERDVLAMQLLGKSALELNPLIDGSAGSLADLATKAHEAGAVLSDEMIAKLGSVDDAFDTLGAGVDAAKNALGLTLMPILQELGDQGTGLLGEFTNAVLDANGDLSEAAPAIGAVFGKAVEFILGQVPKFLEVGVSIISSLITGIASQAPTLIKQAIPVLVGFVTGLIGQLPMLLDAGLKILIALMQGITAALPTLIPAAVTAILGLVGALVENLPMLIDAGIQLLLGLALGLITAIPQLIEALPTIITSLITGLIGAIPQLVMAGVQLFLAIIQNLPAIIGGIIGAVPVIIQALVKTLGDPKFWQQLGAAGLELIKGLWEGIKGAGDWLWRQVKGFFGGLLNQIKDFLGIHSPSTVFAGFGSNLIMGLEKGLTGPNQLKPIMSDLSRQVTQGFQGSLAASARVSVAAGVAREGSVAAAPAEAPAIYVQNPFTGEYLLARTASVASGLIRQSNLDAAIDLGAGGMA